MITPGIYPKSISRRWVSWYPLALEMRLYETGFKYFWNIWSILRENYFVFEPVSVVRILGQLADVL